ncbi:MAG: mobile mystery protein A [Myxococcaceae bacterium]
MRKLMIRQLEQQLRWLQSTTKVSRPALGWVKTMREAFGMTAGQLGKRLNVSQQRVSELEKNEIEGTAALKSIQAAADALNCDFVYFLIPREPIEEIIEKQAKKVASGRLAILSHSMELEDQLVSKKEQHQQISELAKELIDTKPRELWND